VDRLRSRTAAAADGDPETAALGCSLLILYVLTRATGQPLTVALLGVVITMVASRSVNEPDPHQQRITMALLPVPAAVAITAAALLAPHKIASDVVFVAIVFTAVPDDSSPRCMRFVRSSGRSLPPRPTSARATA